MYDGQRERRDERCEQWGSGEGDLRRFCSREALRPATMLSTSFLVAAGSLMDGNDDDRGLDERREGTVILRSAFLGALTLEPREDPQETGSFN